MEFKNIRGDLLNCKRLKQGTFQHVDQLTTERRTNTSLRDNHFFTADGELYSIQNETPLWAITRELQNPFLQDPDYVFDQLSKNGRVPGYYYSSSKNYFPETETGENSFSHSDTTIVNLTKLRLLRDPNSISRGFIKFDPEELGNLNPEERIVAKRIFGPDEFNFQQNMAMLKSVGVSTCIISVLKPEYVKNTLEEGLHQGKKFFGRVSCLSYISTGAPHSVSFYADYAHSHEENCLRGIINSCID